MGWFTRHQQSSFFVYGQPGARGEDLAGVPFAVLDFETTGLSPSTDRVVEIAVVRVESGAQVDEWATLVDPGCDPGPTFIHHITAEMLAGAPTFADVAGELLARLDGCVVVAHNASFEENFLAAELLRIGVRIPSMPALCTLELARNTLQTPNHRLATCCGGVGVSIQDSHTALGDTRATASLLRALLDLAPAHRFPAGPTPLPVLARGVRPRTRASGLRKGEDGWIRSLLTKLPVSTTDADPESAEAYLLAVGEALADGKLTGVEAKQLGRLAGQAGLGAAQVADLHLRVIDGLRDAALADDVLTTSEHRQLLAAAKLLDLDGYFADLTSTVDDGPPPRTRSATIAARRVWCSPAVSEAMRVRLDNAGFAIASNLTRNLVAAVMADADVNSAKVGRARELGIQLHLESEVSPLVDGDGSGTGKESVAVPRSPDNPPPPSVPAGWHPDPTGWGVHRYWDGERWTESVSIGDGRTLSASVLVTAGVAPTWDGLVDGRAPHEWGDALRSLSSSDPSSALALAYRCIDATENDARVNGYGVAPAFYERAAILHRRERQPDLELTVLERFARQPHAPGVKPAQLLERLHGLRSQATGH